MAKLMAVGVEQTIVEQLEQVGRCIWWREVFRCVRVVVHIINAIEVGDEGLPPRMVFV
jgi:hypothetical protein